MKKVLALLLAAIFSMLAFIPASQAFQAYIAEVDESSISAEEVESMRALLEARELYADDFAFELLYDADSKPSFLIGTTSLGSLIMERSSRIAYEWAEFNPFEGCGTGKKFYGGVLQYYIKHTDSERFVNLRTGIEEKAPSKVLTVKDSERAIVPDPITPGGPQNGEIYQFLGASQYIKRYAFGLNTSQTLSCSEVALGIALNYLYRKYNYPLFTADITPEILNKGIINSANIVYDYPKAEKLHQKLIAEFKTLGLFNLVGLIPQLNWGKTYRDGINKCIKKLMPYNSNRPTASYYFLPSISKIADELAANRPVIVHTLAAPTYGSHALVCFGARRVMDNSLGVPTWSDAVCVHTGWYDSSNHVRFNYASTGSGYVWEHKNIWINLSCVKYAYCFNLPGK